MTKYILGGISVPPGTGKDEVIAAAAKKLRRAGIPASRPAIWRRSVDARKQNDIRIVYAVLFETPGTQKKVRERRYLTNNFLKARFIQSIMKTGLCANSSTEKNGASPLLLERKETRRFTNNQCLQQPQPPSQPSKQ